MSRIIPDPISLQADTLPPQTDVVVIGGGIVGICTALYLSRKNVRVVVCEKGLIGAEQSSRNWGWVRQMGRDVAEIPLSIASQQLWRDFQAQGIETGFRQTGIAYVYRSAREEALYQTAHAEANQFGVDTRLLDKSDLARQVPGACAEFMGGMYTASDGRAEPSLATPAIARAAQAAGARILAGCAVRGLIQEGGRATGVVTERGEIRCTTVVLAGGAWSRLFARTLGISLPQLKVLGSVGRVSAVDGPTDMPIGGDNFSYRRRLDGTYTISLRNRTMVPLAPDNFRLFREYWSSFARNRKELRLNVGNHFIREWQTPKTWQLDEISPFERERILDPKPSEATVREGLANLVQAFPAFRNAKLIQTWGGMIDVTPDAVPIIGPAAKIPGLFISTGFSGHGFGLGPGAGLLTAQMVMNDVPVVDPKPFRLERFA
ncbi:oxidoreductase [Bordetella ansorpii]|uniref:Oxidoreductase n=1 Tax=Bordetella ansorpii TaxID=288768 RepID=A0A157NFS0_9BORD|nr:FAD-binding oxidoreductase [Bordetella ansorpii]SAI20187.1 oxidoreductase [Bordetella ansorpii]